MALGAVMVLALPACGGDDAAGGGGGGGGGDGDAVVAIGAIDSLSGDGIAFGIPPADGVALAVQEINEAGGFEVDGTTYTFELTTVDDQSQEAQAVAGTTELVEDVGARFIFGPTTSALANQAQEITTQSGVMHFSGAGSWESLGYLADPDRPYLFGLQVPAEVRGAVLASGITELVPDAESVGMLSQDDDTTAGNLEAYTDGFAAEGLDDEVILFPPDTTDLAPFVRRAGQADVDVFFYFFPQARAAEAVRLAIDLGVGPSGFAGFNIDPAVATEGLDGRPLPIPAVVAQGTPSWAYPPNEEVESFKERVLEFDPDIPQGSANSIFYTYDTVYMLVEAMQQAGSVDDLDAIAEALQDLTYEGVAGRSCFLDDRRQILYDTGQIFVRDGEVESTTFPSDC